MVADRDAGVDPRFDPVFQRGYDPAKHGGRRQRAMPRHATAETPVTPIRDPAVAQDAADQSADPRGSVRAARPVHDSRDTRAEYVAPAADAAEAPDIDAEPRGRNPFRLALLLVSIVSGVGGAWLYWRRFQEDPYGGSGYSQTPSDLFFYQLVDALMEPLLTGALVGFCLWLVLWAIRPRTNRVD